VRSTDNLLTIVNFPHAAELQTTLRTCALPTNNAQSPFLHSTTETRYLSQFYREKMFSFQA
ncbi:hypothetical protein, partial [Actinobacillus pleuropneumoniae]|uniref:hypothetical protein n=1 Tax=Actinobacillus pleuropneumoniae TaxID=715 RepID=UPI00227B68A5